MFAQNAWAWGDEKGGLNIRNYSPQEYGAHAQNLCITQDKRGIMYFGNNSGVLQYDGNYWSLIDISAGKSVTQLAVDSSGVVYVGADEDLGYLLPNASGKMVFHSLLSKLPKEVETLERFVGVFPSDSGVYFITRKYVLFYNKKSFSVIEPEAQIHNSFLVGDQIFLTLKTIGIHYLKKGKLVALPGAEALQNTNIYDISMFRGNMVITTSDDGIYVYRGNHLQLVNKEIVNVYNAINVFNTYYAVGLYGDGLVVLNKNFEKEFFFGLNNGLQDGTISDIFVDRENNLWLALVRGIAKIELISPISLHNFNTGLNGTVEDVIRHKGKIYASTLNGVFYMDPAAEGEKKFKQVQNLSIDCYGMCNFILEGDTVLLISGVDGVYEMLPGNIPHKVMEGAPWNVQQSISYKNRVIVAEYGGLSSFVRKEGKWVTEGMVEGIEGDIFNFVEMKNGELWLGTSDIGVVKTDTRVFTDKNTKITFYDSTSGIPSGLVYLTLDPNDNVVFGTDNGIFQFNKKQKKFYKDKKYDIKSPTGKTGIHRVNFDKKGHLWTSVFYSGNSYDVMFYKNNNWYKTPFLRYNGEIVHAMYHESDGTTWIGSASGLLRFDQNFQKEYESLFDVSIREVRGGNKLIFEGAFFNSDSLPVSDQPDWFVPELAYTNNNLEIKFSALSFFDEKATLFSFILEGQDNEWSRWSSSSSATFTNIHEGEYIFRVKARNVYGVESEEATFRFIILPPWYRTIWAYITYIIFFIAFVWGAISVSTRSLKRIIQERTAEIVHQKEEIEKQKEIVEEKNKDILDSIKYAKRIQDAILPEEETMKDVMGKDLFVLFRPKDIVSGDFYWMKVKGPKVLFAAVDCTGHGVPGAFVSIVGNNGLNRAVNEFGLVKPAMVLDNLAVNVEESFRQQGHSEVRDGMDISLCSLEMLGFNQAKLEWSGANNPIWIIKGENPTEVLEVKADKQPIGKFENRKPFTNHEFDLVKGDTIYIFTDGFADQFGGPQGKKFKYSQLKELLLSLQNLSMANQRQIISNKFDEWKNELEQIDDVCIIGVRI